MCLSNNCRQSVLAQRCWRSSRTLTPTRTETHSISKRALSSLWNWWTITHTNQLIWIKTSRWLNSKTSNLSRWSCRNKTFVIRKTESQPLHLSWPPFPLQAKSTTTTRSLAVKKFQAYRCHTSVRKDSIGFQGSQRPLATPNSLSYPTYQRKLCA